MWVSVNYINKNEKSMSICGSKFENKQFFILEHRPNY